MSMLRAALDDYLTIKRALGFKLKWRDGSSASSWNMPMRSAPRS